MVYWIIDGRILPESKQSDASLRRKSLKNKDVQNGPSIAKRSMPVMYRL
jgi:hypothetical protein